MHTSCLNLVWGHDTVASVTALAVTDQSVRGVEVSAAFGGGVGAHVVDLPGVRLRLALFPLGQGLNPFL